MLNKEFVKDEGVEEDQAFEIGKAYRHASGKTMKIVGEADTSAFGPCLVGEIPHEPDLQPVGRDRASADGWLEITPDEWEAQWDDD